MNIHGFILPSRIIGGLFLVIALVLGGVAIWLYFSSAAAIQTATRTIGTVVEIKESPDEDGIKFTPVFRFRDAAGQDHTVISSFSSNPPSYSVNDAVVVLYPPARPNDAWIDGFWSNWLLTIVFALAFVPNLLVAIFFIWFIPFIIRRVWPIPAIPNAPPSAVSALPAAIGP